MSLVTFQSHRRRLIALCGPAGSGKDTAAGIIHSLLHKINGEQPRRYAFAEPVKDMITVLMAHVGQVSPTSPQWIEDRALKELPIDGLGHSYRRLAQTLGTEWGRNLDPDFWVKLMRSRIENVWFTSHGQACVLITDLRFPNEAKMVEDLGGAVWRISGRSAAIGGGHVSEQHIHSIQCAEEIDNSGSLADLQDKLQAALDRYTHELHRIRLGNSVERMLLIRKLGI
jgi:energy-coupling factor transporter ATP-binding protein EcfA2